MCGGAGVEAATTQITRADPALRFSKRCARLLGKRKLSPSLSV
jgi:hypothetical protein